MTHMRVDAVEPGIVEVPLRRPVRGVHGVTAVQRSVLVRVATNEGAEGWGDVDPTPGYSRLSVEDIVATVAGLTTVLLGLDPFNIRRALAVMDANVEGRLEAKAAVEMALWDLKARALGVPLHSLLGGRVKDRVTLNAWIGTVPPAQAATEAREWVTRGFASAKIKLEGPDPEGVARVAAVRDAVGDALALRVDFNESLPVADAVPFIRKLQAFGLTMVETAAAAGLGVVIGHGFGLTLSTLAEATLAALSPAVLDGCEAVGPLKMAGDVVTAPAVLDRGVIALPDTPGLGADVDREALARYQRRGPPTGRSA